MVNALTGCWIYRGSIDDEGYGRFGSRMAHRHYYEQLVGPVPDGLVLDHLCARRNCVNPAHLEPVTPQENQARAVAYRQLASTRSTTCRKGHEYVDGNFTTYTRQSTSGAPFEERVCLVCKRARQRAGRTNLKEHR
jgi:hypothetical protein